MLEAVLKLRNNPLNGQLFICNYPGFKSHTLRQH